LSGKKTSDNRSTSSRVRRSWARSSRSGKPWRSRGPTTQGGCQPSGTF